MSRVMQPWHQIIHKDIRTKNEQASILLVALSVHMHNDCTYVYIYIYVRNTCVYMFKICTHIDIEEM